MRIIVNIIFIVGIVIGIYFAIVSDSIAEEREPCPLECEVYVECLPCDMVKDKDGTMKGHGGWCYVNK